MPAKLSIDFISQEFTKCNCTLLSTEYHGNTQKLDFICSCGMQHNISWLNFRIGQRCKFCAYERTGRRNAYTDSELRKICEDKGCEFISNHGSKIKFKCKCGQIDECKLGKFSKNNKKLCKECGRKRISEFQSYSIEELKQIFEINNCKLLSTEYYPKISKHLDYICQCGEVNKTTINAFIKGSRCQNCRKKKLSELYRFSYDFVKGEFERFGYELLSDNYQNCFQYLDFICPHNHVGRTQFAWFMNGSRCRECWKTGHKETLLLEKPRRKYKRKSLITWRKKVLKRDGNTCQCCNSDFQLEAHHLYNYKDYPDLIEDLDNGITLCRKCHKTGKFAFHKIFGNRHNTKDQFEIWANLYRGRLCL